MGVCPFIKMVASGNDFVVLDYRQNDSALTPAQIQHLCHRRTGIGADQVLCLFPSDQADLTMTIFNQDESTAAQCGNGLRALATLIFQENPDRQKGSIEVNGHVHRVQKCGDDVSVSFKTPTFFDLPPLDHELAAFNPVGVDVGNLHLILWTEGLAAFDLSEIAPRFQTLFLPDSLNVHVVQILSEDEISMKHWERGVGETDACGSGAIASVFAGHHQKILADSVRVHFKYDTVEVSQKASGYYLKGRAQIVFRGSIDLST